MSSSIEPKPGDSNSREVRAGRIACELQERMAGGEVVSESEVLAAHPDLAGELCGHLAVLRTFRRDEDGLDDLLRQGLLAPCDSADGVARLGRFRIVGVLGRGAMGIVLKAIDDDLKRIVAIKILPPDLAADEAALARFAREAEAAAKLSHPNIVTVHELGHASGAHHIVMEFVDGPTLARLVREYGPIPAAEARRLFEQLLAGLSAAHGAGLIHRDIKSSNLLIDRRRAAAQTHGTESVGSDDGTAAKATDFEIRNSPFAILKIADFGLARFAEVRTRLTLPDQSPGTPEYMSPEQARGETDLDARTDLYSAGVVLYEMLTGTTPFRAASPSAVIHRLLTEPPGDPRRVRPGADAHLSALALRLMAKRREDRLPSAEVARTALHDGRPVGLVRPPRGRWILPALGMVGAVAVGVGLFVGLRPSPPALDARVSEGRYIHVRRGGDNPWRDLGPRFGEDVQLANVAVAKPAEGPELIVASLERPREDGASFVAFDEAGEEVWHLKFRSDRAWPDCELAYPYWVGSAVFARDIDGRPGDELVVIASELGEYPTRISILDPADRRIRATLWHHGDLHPCDREVGIAAFEDDFFGTGRPAFRVHGLNNKLDAFDEPRADDPPPLTGHDIVPVLMVLDLRAILEQCEGLPGGEVGGPPFAARSGLPPARIHAYAFLELSSSDRPTYRPGDPVPKVEPRLEQVGGFGRVHRIGPGSAGTDARWLLVDVKMPKIDDAATLVVDGNLYIREVSINPQQVPRRPLGAWKSLWVPVIRDGQYVGKPRGERADPGA